MNPDFVKLAESFNIAGRRVTTPEELREALREGLDLKGSMVIDYVTPSLPMVRHVTRGRRRGAVS